MLLVLITSLLGYLSSKPSLDKKSITYFGDEELTQNFVREGGYTQYKSIVVSKGITGIGSNCFQSCVALTDIMLPESCQYLNSNCFQSCTKLQSIYLPEGLKTIGKAVFQSCSKLHTIYFPSTITKIETQQTFQTCDKLSQYITKDKGMLSSNADNSILIFNKTRLIAISHIKATQTIPKEITVIAEFIGSYIKTLTKVIFESNSSLKIIERGAFRHTSVGAVHIPEGVKEVYENLIEQASLCTVVSFPSTLRYVSDTVFYSAVGLTEVNIKNSNGAKIDENGLITNQNNVILFANRNITILNITKDIEEVPISLIQLLPNLTTLTVSSDHPTLSATENLLYMSTILCGCPGGIKVAYVRSNTTSVGVSAFAQTQIEMIYFNGTEVTSFSARCFEKTYNLSYLEIPIKLQSVGNFAFQNCGLNCDIEFPRTLNKVDYTSFTYSKVTKLNFSKCNDLVKIDYEFARGCLELVTVIFPPNLAGIENDSFRSAKGLSYINIPKSVSYIKTNAFVDCSNLRTVTFDNNCNLSIISSLAFKNCNLTEISIPDNVEIIETEAFYGNKYLTKLEFGEESLLNETFPFMIQGCNSLETIKFGKNLHNIKPTSLSLANNLTKVIIAEENPTYKSINGLVYSRNLTQFVSCPCGVSQPEIEGNIISFGDSAFYGCSKVVSIEFGNVPLEIIGSSAFYGCSSLASIVIPSSVTDIRASAFYGCTALESVKMVNDSKLTELQNGVFAGCVGLRRVIFEDGSHLESVDDGVFKDCRKLVEFTFPPLLKSIGASAFEGCIELENVSFCDKLEEIGSRAFYGCSKLFYIAFPNSLLSLGTDSLANCEELFALTYCGTNDLSGATAFSNSPYAVVYVTSNYTARTFGGLNPARTLDRDCRIPTVVFTVGDTEGSLRPSIAIAAMPIVEEEDKRRCLSVLEGGKY